MEPHHQATAHNESTMQPQYCNTDGFGDTEATAESTKLPPPGYPRLAEWMGFVPEQAIFRRFGALNTINLLYLQAELVDLEKELRKLQAVDSQSPSVDKQRYATNWLFLSQSKRDGDEKQWNLVLKIRGKLNEFNTAVIQQRNILRMTPPSPYDLDYIQKYLDTSEMGPLALSGSDSDIWGSIDKPENRAHDLISLLARSDGDNFSKLLAERASNLFFRFGSSRITHSWKAPHVQSLDTEDLLRWTQRMTSVVASALPMGSIIILSYVQSSTAKLVIVLVFNVLLALSLAFFTTARPVEVFAVAAAFSAVQVAFVQVGSQE